MILKGRVRTSSHSALVAVLMHFPTLTLSIDRVVEKFLKHVDSIKDMLEHHRGHWILQLAVSHGLLSCKKM